jgi:hypothetical protein
MSWLSLVEDLSPVIARRLEKSWRAAAASDGGIGGRWRGALRATALSGRA